MEDLVGDTIRKGNSTTEHETGPTLRRSKVIALYFAAHWAPPCRAFLETLLTFHLTANARHGAGCFEVILISDDRSQQAYEQHFAAMPWAALPYPERERKDEIKKLFGINGIPALVILSYPDCLVITDDGVGDLYKRGADLWADWDYELARVAARQRVKDEEF